VKEIEAEKAVLDLKHLQLDTIHDKISIIEVSRGATALSITTFSITTLSIMTFYIINKMLQLSVIALSIMTALLYAVCLKCWASHISHLC
jgi:hypothetical protein